MFTALIVFKHGGVAAFRAHTLEKLTELISEKMNGRDDWSSVTYENFVDGRDLSLIQKIRKRS